MYPCFGFGGKLPNDPTRETASHCFALNGDIFYPECSGKQGLLNAYYQSLGKVELSGPTKFSQLLEYTNGVCKL